MMKKIFSVLAILLLVFFISILIGAVFFHRYIQSDEFKEKLTNAVSHTLSTQFHLGKLDFNILTGFELHDVAVDNPPPNNDERFIHIKKVDLNYLPFALFNHQFVIHQLALTQPEITIHLNNDGSSNVPNIKKSENTSLPLINIEDLNLIVVLNRFNLLEGQLLLLNADGEQLFAMNGATIEGNYELIPTGAQSNGKINVETITLGSTFRITNASSPITYEKKVLSFSEIKGVSYMGEATGSIQANFEAKESSFNIDLKLIDAQIPALAQDFGKDLDWLQGKLLLTTQLEGSLLQPKLLTGKGDFSVQEIGVTKFKLLQDIATILLTKELASVQFKDIKGTFKVGDQKITFFNIEAVADNAQLSGAGSITFDRQVDFDVLLAVNDKLNIPSEIESKLTKRDDGFHTIAFKVTGPMNKLQTNLPEKIGNIAVDIIQEKVPEKYKKKANQLLQYLQGPQEAEPDSPTPAETETPSEEPAPAAQ